MKDRVKVVAGELTPHGEQLRGAAHHGQLSLAEDESPAVSTGVFN